MTKTGLQENPMPPKTLQVLNQIVNFVPLERKRAKDQERAERSVAVLQSGAKVKLSFGNCAGLCVCLLLENVE